MAKKLGKYVYYTPEDGKGYDLGGGKYTKGYWAVDSNGDGKYDASEKVALGNRIRNSDGSYIQLNSDGTSTVVKDKKGTFNANMALTDTEKTAMSKNLVYGGRSTKNQDGTFSRSRANKMQDQVWDIDTDREEVTDEQGNVAERDKRGNVRFQGSVYDSDNNVIYQEPQQEVIEEPQPEQQQATAPQQSTYTEPQTPEEKAAEIAQFSAYRAELPNWAEYESQLNQIKAAVQQTDYQKEDTRDYKTLQQLVNDYQGSIGYLKDDYYYGNSMADDYGKAVLVHLYHEGLINGREFMALSDKNGLNGAYIKASPNFTKYRDLLYRGNGNSNPFADYANARYLSYRKGGRIDYIVV